MMALNFSFSAIIRSYLKHIIQHTAVLILLPLHIQCVDTDNYYLYLVMILDFFCISRYFPIVLLSFCIVNLYVLSPLKITLNLNVVLQMLYFSTTIKVGTLENRINQ